MLERAARRAARLVPLRGEPGPPDFVGVGAIGSNALWWFGLLADHPALRPPRNRLPAQYAFPDFWAREAGPDDVRAYHERFAHQPDTLSGEWTESYMVQPWTPPVLAQMAPEAKLLVMLADPFEVYRGLFQDRLQRAESGEKRTYMNTAAAYGRYASQLRALFEFFAPERVLVLQYERCRDDVPGQYRRTLEFLGVDADHAPPGRAPDAAPRADLWPELDDALHVALDPEIEALRDLVGDLDLGLWAQARP